MTASKALLQERQIRKCTEPKQVFIKLEISLINSKRVLLYGNFAKGAYTHDEAKSLANMMINNNACS